MSAVSTTRRRGGPLVMLGLLLGAWIAGRAAIWESPFPLAEPGLPKPELLSSQPTAVGEKQGDRTGQPLLDLAKGAASYAAFPADPVGFLGHSEAALISLPPEPDAGAAFSPAIRADPVLRLSEAFKAEPGRANRADPGGQQQRAVVASPVAPPVAPPLAPGVQGVDRWSLDAFAFYRAGSNSTAISQGRVPVYGASQAGANLQYRIAPGSSHDSRAFLRAYHAFIPDGENEIAAGISARPIGAIPVRAFAELRVTDNVFGTDLRPAAYIVTELPPARLPFDFSLEAYGGAGYVGGAAATAFVDGQVGVTRELARFGGAGTGDIRISLGAGSWGGAQEDANRLDVGPTIRVDLNVGEVPARISLDWRERVAGDASPVSGLAATLSTRF